MVLTILVPGRVVATIPNLTGRRARQRYRPTIARRQVAQLPGRGELRHLEPFQEGRLAGAVRTDNEDGQRGRAEVRLVQTGGQTEHGCGVFDLSGGIRARGWQGRYAVLRSYVACGVMTNDERKSSNETRAEIAIYFVFVQAICVFFQ